MIGKTGGAGETGDAEGYAEVNCYDVLPVIVEEILILTCRDPLAPSKHSVVLLRIIINYRFFPSTSASLGLACNSCMSCSLSERGCL
jgi:hypothetical protein